MNSPRGGHPVGHQEPRILWSPPRVSSAGKEVVELARSAGLTLDPWQQLVLNEALGERADGTWAASEVGLVVSRQNGKGSILEAVELADLFLLDGEMTIHSAHLFDTSLEAFNRIMTLIEQTPDLERFVTRVVRSHGEEGIEVFRGFPKRKRRLRFKTRTKGGGRGLSGDRVIVDEAMYYSPEQDAALRPTLSARPNPQLWLTGSAGTKESVQLGRIRNAALAGTNPRLCYLEWSIDGCTDFCPADCQEHDPVDSVESYGKANPGLGIRISAEHIEGERASMAAETFLCERLGVGDWPVEGESWRVIDEESWLDRVDEVSEPATPLVFAVDVTPDRRYACIAVAGSNGEGMVHVEITGDGIKLDHRPGTRWVVPRVHELWKKWRPAAVVVDKGSQAGMFVDELEALGVKVLTPTMREFAQGCGAFYGAIVPRRGNTPSLVHTNQVPLTTAVAGAERREMADLWAWDKRNAAVDISPLVAVTLATWGHAKVTVKPKARPRMAWG
ncbi:terminase [Streptomyces sp. NPDC101227]|uniref:terminase n=1 Tax=Streptomyces sp. NPDC101227 TaxID=3366136 RepID=UPI0037FD794B